MWKLPIYCRARNAASPLQPAKTAKNASSILTGPSRGRCFLASAAIWTKPAPCAKIGWPAANGIDPRARAADPIDRKQPAAPAFCRYGGLCVGGIGLHCEARGWPARESAAARGFAGGGRKRPPYAPREAAAKPARQAPAQGGGPMRASAPTKHKARFLPAKPPLSRRLAWPISFRGVVWKTTVCRAGVHPRRTGLAGVPVGGQHRQPRRGGVKTPPYNTWQGCGQVNHPSVRACRAASSPP